MSTADPATPVRHLPGHPALAEPPSYPELRREAVRLRSQERRQQRARERAERRLRVEHRRFDDERTAYPMPEELRARYDHLAAGFDAQIRRGATVHCRPPRTVRWVPPVIAALDFAVLFTFCADVFNVDLGRLSREPLPAVAVTVLLAVLGSGVGYAWLSLTGYRLRNYRTAVGELAWEAVGRSSRLLLAVAGVVVATLATLMYVRVQGELATAPAGLTAQGAAVAGGAFAVLAAVANLSVVAIHAVDGSPHAEELRHIGRLLLRRERAVERAG